MSSMNLDWNSRLSPINRTVNVPVCEVDLASLGFVTSPPGISVAWKGTDNDRATRARKGERTGLATPGSKHNVVEA